MKKIGVSMSDHQRRRLHNGHSVRVKKGEGIMLVNPTNFDTMSRTFLRGKAKEIKLTPEEIKANKLISPEAHNFNRDEMNPAPSVAPQVAPIKTSPITGGHISNVGGTRGIRVNTMAGMKNVSDHLQSLGNETGRNYGFQLKAGLENAYANDVNADMIDLGIFTGKNNLITGNITGGGKLGDARRSIQGRGQIGVAGNLLSQRGLPQALQSQPFSENWGFANQLPPSYHKFNRSV
jgi:hypothetical protein